MKKKFQIFKKYIRYIVAVFVLAFVVLVNKNFFQNFTLTSEQGAGGNFPVNIKDASLTEKKSAFYVNDAVGKNPGEYYRLIFEEKTTHDVLVKISLARITDEEVEIGSINFKRADDFIAHELIFRTSDGFSDLVFKKANAADGSGVWIRNINISKLNIGSESEIANLKPSIIGKNDVSRPVVSQTGSDIKFRQLKEPGIILGQIFKAESNYITSVVFDIDITKTDNRGDKKYKLEIRPAEWDGETGEVFKEVIADESFMVEDLEKYRQSDGKIRFPIFSLIEPDKYYFIGINNDNIETDEFNNLTLKGSNDAKYGSGSCLVRRSGRTFAAGGDLYFILYGAKFSEYGSEKFLAGSIIEDIGKGLGIYIYKTSSSLTDFLDLESHTKDVRLAEDGKLVAGSIDEPDSNFIYKFNTIYPFKKISIKAQQSSLNWSRVKIFYSFNQEDWKEIEGSLQNEIQDFNYSLENKGESRNLIYLKVMPDLNNQTDAKIYGIANLKIEAQLIMK